MVECRVLVLVFVKDRWACQQDLLKLAKSDSSRKLLT